MEHLILWNEEECRDVVSWKRRTGTPCVISSKVRRLTICLLCNVRAFKNKTWGHEWLSVSMQACFYSHLFHDASERWVYAILYILCVVIYTCCVRVLWQRIKALPSWIILLEKCDLKNYSALKRGICLFGIKYSILWYWFCVECSPESKNSGTQKLMRWY